jgi:hypothetical protein
MANTETTKLFLSTKEHFLLQTGTIPVGVTSSRSKYPLNESVPIEGSPNIVGGPTQSPLIPLAEIFPDFTVTTDGNWIRKIKPGDLVQITRGNIRHEYFIKNSFYDSITDKTTILLNNKRDVVSTLDPFIGTTGYNNASIYTYLVPGRKMESPNDVSIFVDSFMIKMKAGNNPDVFSVEASWKIDPSVKVTRLRWRSVPRNSEISSLTYAVTTSGNYYQVPSAVIESTSGRKAQIQPTVSIDYFTSITGGTGYSSAPSLTVSGGGGTGASFTVSVTGGAVSGITVVSGGTGYSSNPVFTFSGPGTGAAATPIFKLSGVLSTQDGGGYLSKPTVKIDETSHVGATYGDINAYLHLNNLGKVDYFRVVNGGTGYTGASVSVSGSIYMDEAEGLAEIVNGSVNNIVLTKRGYGYDSSNPPIVTITPHGSGAGAVAVANIDTFSDWVYEDPTYSEYSRTISGFKYNIPYEIEILASRDENFRGLMKYSSTTSFQYIK